MAAPDSNNRVDPSPYYPVFGRRMVMISYARRLPNRRFGGLAFLRGHLPGFEHGFLGVASGGEGRSRALVGAPINPIGAPNTRGRTPAPPLLV
jgi:hypothetical protein